MSEDAHQSNNPQKKPEKDLRFSAEQLRKIATEELRKLDMRAVAEDAFNKGLAIGAVFPRSMWDEQRAKYIEGPFITKFKN